MEPPPPSQIMLQAEAAAAPPCFQLISAASMLTSMLKSAEEKNLCPLTTGVPAVDASDGALGGGLPLGTVVGVSADASGGMGRTLALKMMCRHLMHFGNKNQRAMVIDSTGTFDVAKLVEVARGCTTREFTKNGVRMVWRERQEVESVLERVGITRVFDIEGVWDVIGKIRAGRTEEERYEGEHAEKPTGHGKEQREGGNEEVKMGQDDLEMEDGGMRGGLVQEQDDNQGADRSLRIGLQAPDQPLPSAQHAAQSIPEMDDKRSDDTLLAHPFAASAGLLPILDSPDSPDSPPPAPRPQSSPLTPPPPSREAETSSPLSSPPKSPAPSSSLHSELVIEPSPVRQNMNTVLSQAYQGEPIPSSSPSEEEAEPSPPLEEAVSPSPLPPSSPPIIHNPAAQPRDALPTDGFESHLATDAARRPQESDSISDSSSDTSSYVSSPSPARNLLPPGSQWDHPSHTTEPPSILIIDSLPPLLTTLFGESSDRTSAHKLLQQLTRVLTQLSRSTVNPLSVIILNSTKELTPAKSIEEGIVRSVFADVKEVPSFGAVFDGMVDCSLLVRTVPARQEDAERLYGGAGERGVRWTNVLECLRDDIPDLRRWMEKDGDEGGTEERHRRQKPGKRTNREGRWGAFDVVKEQSQEGEELVFKDPNLGRKLGEYEIVHFGRRP